METALKKVQRFLYLGSDVPFAFDPPKALDLETGKSLLAPLVKPGVATEHKVEAPGNVAVVGSSKSHSKKAGKQPVDKQKTTGKDAAGSTDVTASKGAAESTIKPVPSPILAMIGTTITNKALRRTDECLFALAYCAREFPTSEERHEVYQLLPKLIRTSAELFMFLSYYTQLATQSGHAGFGHGLRKAVTHWYERFTPFELAELLVRDISSSGWSHKDVVAKVHPKLASPEKQLLIDSAMKRSSQLQQKQTPVRKGKKKATSNNAPEAKGDPSTSKALKRYQALLQFRSAPNVTSVLELVKQHGAKGTMSLLPKHFRRSAKVWEVFYPHVSYRELLHAVLPMQDYRLLEEGEPNADKFAEMLAKRLDALETEQIHPIEVQQIAKLYRSNKRYSSLVKESIHHIQQPEMLPPLKQVLDGLNLALDRSFTHHPKTGARYYIALDLRTLHDRKKTLFNEMTSCFQASVMLAFSIFKREKHVTVVAFTDNVTTLTPVAFEPTMGWEQAIEHCVGLMLPKTKVSLAAPIKQAETQKLKVDVFITITDSLIRVHPTRIPPLTEMQEYRKKAKLNLSRYVAISLHRHEPSFEFPQDADVGGMLEMVGYSANNAKIIEAFAKNLFF
uniref:TROVE domain-containing protein n=1 Tax=Anopheles dirus TaxID=7168 RepID=A0A182N4W7_9DIPT